MFIFFLLHTVPDDCPKEKDPSTRYSKLVNFHLSKNNTFVKIAFLIAFYVIFYNTLAALAVQLPKKMFNLSRFCLRFFLCLFEHIRASEILSKWCEWSKRTIIRLCVCYGGCFCLVQMAQALLRHSADIYFTRRSIRHCLALHAIPGIGDGILCVSFAAVNFDGLFSGSRSGSDDIYFQCILKRMYVCSVCLMGFFVCYEFAAESEAAAPTNVHEKYS